jgi:hypothetical protein
MMRAHASIRVGSTRRASNAGQTTDGGPLRELAVVASLRSNAARAPPESVAVPPAEAPMRSPESPARPSEVAAVA